MFIYERYALCEAWRNEFSREPFFAPSFLLLFPKNKLKNTDFSQVVQAKVKQNVNLVICQVVYKSIILRDDYLTGGLELKKE